MGKSSRFARIFCKKKVNENHESYYDSAEGQEVTRARAEQEMKKHGHKPGSVEWQEFEKFMKNRPTVDAQELLGFLGY